MKTLLLSLSLLFGTALIAQKGKTSSSSKKPAKHYGITSTKHWHTLKIAEQQVKVQSYYNALSSYLEVYEAYPDNEYLLYRLGHAYYLGRDYQNATKYYDLLVTKHKKTQFLVEQ